MSYSEDELVGALVVDSEGYICGNIEKIELLPTGILMVTRSEKGGGTIIKKMRTE